MIEIRRELDLRDYIASNFSKFFEYPVKTVSKEFRLPNNKRVDVVGHGNETLYFVEIKLEPVDKKAVEQIKSYIDVYKKETSLNIVGILLAYSIKDNALELANKYGILFKKIKGVQHISQPIAIKVRLKELLAEKGITPAKLTEDAGLSRQAIKGLLSGYMGRIDLTTLDKICRALKCKPGDILDYKE